MCRDDMTLLLNNFDLQLESQAFKARIEDLEIYPGHKHDFKSTVSMLNFFCQRCRCLGSVTEYRDNLKCTAVKSNSRNRSVKSTEKSNWEKGF